MSAALVGHAAEVTARLHEDADSEVGLPLDEAICPSCLLAYFMAAGRSGVCRDCGDDLEPFDGLVTLTGDHIALTD